jgi:hypothetical protein
MAARAKAEQSLAADATACFSSNLFPSARMLIARHSKGQRYVPSCWSNVKMYRVDQKMVTAGLDEKGWLYRALEVSTPEGTYRVNYNGRGLGHESVTVNGEFAAGRTSAIWFIPEFSFSVGSQQALVKVKVWPWFAIRSLELLVGGELVYSE